MGGLLPREEKEMGRATRPAELRADVRAPASFSGTSTPTCKLALSPGTASQSLAWVAGRRGGQQQPRVCRAKALPHIKFPSKGWGSLWTGAGRHCFPPSQACGSQEASSRAAPTHPGLGRSCHLRGAWGKEALSQPRGGGLSGGNDFPAALGCRHHTHMLHNTGHRLSPPQGTIIHAGTGTGGPDPALTHPPVPTGWAQSGQAPSTLPMG